MNEPPVQLWIITTNDGTILSAHCRGYMAGLGECCSHVASILFYLEVSTRLNEKLTCTQVKCSWILPNTVKTVDYSRVMDIYFRSAKKMKSNLDKSMDSLVPCSEGLELNVDMTCESESVKSIKSSKPKSISTKPSSAELEEFHKSLSECKVKPVCLSLEKPYADSFILKTRNIGSVSDLFDPKLMDFKLHRPT